MNLADETGGRMTCALGLHTGHLAMMATRAPLNPHYLLVPVCGSTLRARSKLNTDVVLS